MHVFDALDHGVWGATSTLQRCGYTKTDCMIVLVTSNFGFAQDALLFAIIQFNGEDLDSCNQCDCNGHHF